MLVFRTFLFSLIILALVFICPGQNTTPTPTQDNNDIKRRMEDMRRQQIELEKSRRDQKEYEQKIIGDLGTKKRKTRAEEVSDCVLCTNKNNRIKKYPNEEELSVIAAEAKYFQQFEEFLRSKKTGLTRLVSDKGCGSNNRIVKAEENCIKYEKIPGYGSTFSFRTNKYVIGRFADIVYKDGILYSFGNLTTGFFTSLGNVSINDVAKSTKGAKYTYSFVPKNKIKEIEEQTEGFVKGIDSNGFNYKKSTKLVKGKTYLLRSVAFKANIKKGGEILFNNTITDKRKDLIVALRVVEIDSEGGITLIWKILEEKKSPKIVFSEK